MLLVNARNVPKEFGNSGHTSVVGPDMIHFTTKSGSSYEYDPEAKKIRRVAGDPKHTDRLQDGEWRNATVSFESDYGATISYEDGRTSFTTRIIRLNAE